MEAAAPIGKNYDRSLKKSLNRTLSSTPCENLAPINYQNGILQTPPILYHSFPPFLAHQKQPPLLPLPISKSNVHQHYNNHVNTLSQNRAFSLPPTNRKFNKSKKSSPKPKSSKVVPLETSDKIKTIQRKSSSSEVVILDSDGYLHLVGRIKELINRGGEKISPIEVDAVLVSHPEIAQAVAFGVPDDKYGEEINCAVIPREGSNIDEAEVLRFCKKNLAAFKVPKKVFMTDSLPKTASGKIQRRLVAEHFLAQISTAKVPKFGA